LTKLVQIEIREISNFKTASKQIQFFSAIYST
jgi:hypothetical protein